MADREHEEWLEDREAQAGAGLRPRMSRLRKNSDKQTIDARSGVGPVGDPEEEDDDVPEGLLDTVIEPDAL